VFPVGRESIISTPLLKEDIPKDSGYSTARLHSALKQVAQGPWQQDFAVGKTVHSITTQAAGNV
jgi:hypothetical protein